MKRMVLPMVISMLACNERAQEEGCYKPNPEPGAMLGSFDLVCGRPYGYRPETPEGLGLEGNGGPYHVALCEPAASSAECSMCPTDDVNERIRDHLLELMVEAGTRCEPAHVHHIIPECVTTPEQISSARSQCCFHAWYWGSCNTKG